MKNLNIENMGIITCNQEGVEVYINEAIVLHLLSDRNIADVTVLPGIIDWKSQNIVPEML